MADLISITEYKALAGITSTDTTRDASITALLPIVSEAVRLYCLRDGTTGFDAVSPRTETYDGTGEDKLQLREWPVASITSIAFIDDSGTSTTLASTEYRLTARSGIVSRIGATAGRFAGSGCWANSDAVIEDSGWGVGPNFPYGVQNITVVYVTSAAVPQGVKYACVRLVDYAMADRGRGSIKSESLGGYSYTLGTVIDKDDEIRGLLAPYRTGVA